MLPSATPKFVQCKSTSTCTNTEYTTIAKLIVHASKKVNGGHTKRLSARRSIPKLWRRDEHGLCQLEAEHQISTHPIAFLLISCRQVSATPIDWWSERPAEADCCAAPIRMLPLSCRPSRRNRMCGHPKIGRRLIDGEAHLRCLLQACSGKDGGRPRKGRQARSNLPSD
jgi:hypothetical protein